jgi:hypothetical protein
VIHFTSPGFWLLARLSGNVASAVTAWRSGRRLRGEGADALGWRHICPARNS